MICIQPVIICCCVVWAPSSIYAGLLSTFVGSLGSQLPCLWYKKKKSLGICGRRKK